MFSLAFSNRFEILLDLLLARLAAERPGPFGARQVVVPSAALRRKVELAVADREGVAANLRFDFLAQWLWQQIGRVVPVPARSPFAPALLAWRIYAELDPVAAAATPDLAAEAARADAAGRGWVAAHPRLARYLDGADARMRFELAERIARVFDHYLTYRPHWLERWADGRGSVLEAGASALERADEAWQAALWRRIRDGLALRQEHPATAFLRTVTTMSADQLAAAGLPATVHVFGLPALPPLYLDLLRELARVVDVRLYVLNPCREFWFDIVDARRLSWLASRQQDLFFDTGNSLLAAWGKQTRSHIGLLFEGEHAVEEEAAFAPHPGRHLLARLQNAILDLQELAPGSVRLAAADRSIELHVCHSRTRELEVLHDRLLGLFKAHAGSADALQPGEVVVLTPELDATAPLIEAVFGTAPAERRIPWRITGLGGTRDNVVAQVLDQALQLAAGRFPASRVFDLLQQPPVAARFGLDAAALETVHDWIRAAGVRWGLDAAGARAVAGADGGTAGAAGGAGSEGVGSEGGGRRQGERAAAVGGEDGATGAAGAAAGGPQHTLDEGLHRLFLAWAAGEAAQHAAFAGRIGAAAPEGQAALALGGFWRYAQTLRWLRDALQRPQPAAGWRALLNEALERLVGDAPEHAEALREVRAALAELAEDIAAGGLTAALPLEVVHPALLARLDDPARGGVPGGSVTFSALSALRGLPYRVVCVIGLDHGLFPGGARAPEFDLMATRPQAGDRQRRLDDRNLFLDLVLAAREVLHLSHVGRSVRDGAALPPSVLVDELLDVLAAATAENATDPAALAAARARLSVAHPLQAFSAEYFLPAARQDPRLASFNEDYARALAARLAAPPAAAQDERSAEAVVEAAADRTGPAAAPGAGRAEGRASAAEQGGAERGGAERGSTDVGRAEHGRAERGRAEGSTAQGDGEGGDGEGGDGEDREPAAGAPFFAAPLPPPGPEWRELGLAQLTRFFRNPCRFLLRERVGLELPETDEELEDVEAFVPDRPARWALAERLLPVLLQAAEGLRLGIAGAVDHGDTGQATGPADTADRVPPALLALARAGGEFPAGALGEGELQRELQRMRAFAAEVATAAGSEVLPPATARLDFRLAGEAWTLSAAFAELRPCGLFRHRYADTGAADYLAAWLEHLVLCAAALPGVECSTEVLARDGRFGFAPLAPAAAHGLLAELLGLYREGLRAPLHFFPRSAWAYVRHGDSLAQAQARWSGGMRPQFGEGADPAYRLALRGVAVPLDERFGVLAARVWRPLLEHLQDARLR